MSTVFITGANRGLGLEFARQLAARGDTVYAACRDPGAADALRALECDRVQIVRLDVTDRASIDAAAKVVDGKLDWLINNAGVYGPDKARQTLGDLDADAMLDVYRTNVLGPTLVLEAMLASGAVGEGTKVVNMSSGAGSIARADANRELTYGCSKAALNMASKICAAKLKERGVTLITQDPGWVRTDMGGPNATLSPEESIADMIALFDRLGPDDSGKYYDRKGSELPW